MRNAMVSEFSQDVLGPLFGINESLDFKPTDRYIIGILAPRDSKWQDNEIIEEDESIDSIGNDGKSLSGQEDTADAGVSFSGGDELSPVIDPRNYPKNMGVSFNCVSETNNPEFELVITYAKYTQSSDNKWSRMPRAIHIKSSDIINGKTYLHLKDNTTGELEIKSSIDGESFLFSSIRGAQKSEQGTIVTIMLVNNEMQNGLKRNEDEYAEKLMFQPEIRIKFAETTNFIDDDVEPESDNDKYENYRYRGREQRARGHLCSATWGAFDPQNLSESDKNDLIIEMRSNNIDSDADTSTINLSSAPPFCWIDGSHPALISVMPKFKHPTLRTEYLPMIVLPAPDMDPSYAPWMPCPSAEEISLASDSHMIRALLEPLTIGYTDWIKTKLTGAPLELVDKANAALRRMNEGIDLLCTNHNSRLAFNIANRAIYQSNLWTNRIKSSKDPTYAPQNFVWRKFQLAFALSTLESVSNPASNERNELDLLWVATGGGKTEAYLLMMAYSIVLRRLQSKEDTNLPQWHGVDVITRYTLRLLTIQQSRRTLGIVTALEWLRNESWSPNNEGLKFSEQPVSLGIWVGGSLTPNYLCRKNDPKDLRNYNSEFAKLSYLSAIPLLKHGHQLTETQQNLVSEPAQILTCPACEENLAFPIGSLSNSKITKIKWVCKIRGITESAIDSIAKGIADVKSVSLIPHDNGIKTLCLEFSRILKTESEINTVWDSLKSEIISKNGSIFLKAFRPGRPGYFPKIKFEKGKRKEYDFEIHCPNHECDLNRRSWTGHLPAGAQDGKERRRDSHIYLAEGWRTMNYDYEGRGMPIPAYTTDSQVYSRAPSIIVATVDKFAQLPKKPETGLIFGSISSHSHGEGFSRNAPKDLGLEVGFNKKIGLLPPNMIVQDELHLIEGPLGSMVGFYETAIDKLASEHPTIENYRVKYIASSATINRGGEQVQCLFDRKMNLFPPKGRDWKDRGLIVEKDDESASSRGERKGRLFMGICPIGTTGLSTQREIFSSLLYHGSNLIESNGTLSDRYWTVVGYYNAVRELAGARTLLSFEVQEAISRLCRHRNLTPLINQRPDQGRIIELSGRMVSSHLPQLLSNLELQSRQSGDATDVLLSTSMFGTGVDVDRLNLMIVSGQPKTTAQYIQAAGRVGRDKGGLIVTYLRSSRPRDLDHYERFIGYHAQINRHVEAVTVRPFAEPVLDKAGGAVQLSWLRNSRNVDPVHGTVEWSSPAAAHAFLPGTGKTTDMNTAMSMIEKRHDKQAPERQIIQSPPNYIRSWILEPGYDRWINFCRAAGSGSPPQFLEWSVWRKLRDPPGRRWSVFAGELQVGDSVDQAVYSNDYQTPNSLRTTDGEIQVRSRGDR